MNIKKICSENKPKSQCHKLGPFKLLLMWYIWLKIWNLEWVNCTFARTVWIHAYLLEIFNRKFHFTHETIKEALFLVTPLLSKIYLTSKDEIMIVFTDFMKYKFCVTISYRTLMWHFLYFSLLSALSIREAFSWQFAKFYVY